MTSLMPMVAPTAAQQALMEAAERIVARRGAASTTDRAIINEAGSANNSAIAYHFGNRAELLNCLWDWRSRPVNERRMAILEDIARRGDEGDERALAAAHVVPLKLVLTRLYPSSWARFNEQRMHLYSQSFLDHFRILTADGSLERFESTPLAVLTHLFMLMARRVGGDDRRAARRVGMVVNVVISSLSSWERDVDAGRAALDDLAPLCDDLMDVVAAILDGR